MLSYHIVYWTNKASAPAATQTR